MYGSRAGVPDWTVSAVTGSHSPIRVLAAMEAAWVVGPAKNLIEFARRARPRVELAIVAFLRGEGASNPFVEAAEAASIRVFRITERRRWDPGALSLFRAAAAEFHPDILQSHNVKSHLFVRLLGLHRTYPWIAFNHGYTATDLKDRLYNHLDRWSLPAADRVVAVCAPFARSLEARGVRPERIRIQQNSVKPFAAPPESEVAALRGALRLAADERVLLAVGRLSLEKGHRDLLAAVALLRQRPALPPFRAVLVGDGPERPNLERQAADSGIADVVTFAGHQPGVAPYYALAYALALPSHSEGSPNVVLEAMAAGVPVAATAVGGVPEMLRDSAGLVVAPGDPAAMAAALERLLGDPELGRSCVAAAAARVAAEFTPEAYCESMTGVYEDLLESRPAAPSR